MSRLDANEGFVTIDGRRTWYRMRGGDPNATPLVLIHGGPGMPGEAMEPLEELAADRVVIRYDQIGCGRSDWPDDPSLWTVDLFVRELQALRDELGLDTVHLLGWSWGGSLALQYLLGKPAGVRSLILASAPFSTQLWIEESRRLRAELPDHVRETIDRFEAGWKPRRREEGSGRVEPGQTSAQMARAARAMGIALSVMDRPSARRLAHWMSSVPFLRGAAFELASMAFLRRHVCRLDRLPLPMLRGLAGWNKQLYETMWGPSEFIATGVLADWDVEHRLGEVTVPTLITSGRFDEATEEQMRRMRDGIVGARWEVFEASAHAAFIEEPERYQKVLRDFLAEVDAS